jgi:predicted neuraminidase
MELQIVETAADQLFAVFRTKGGCLYQTFSTDGGRTWSPSVPSPLPSPESMARMIRLQSGKLLVVWNPVASTTQQPRHPLAAAISPDGGRTWTPPKLIADETGTNQLSNHGLTQLDDGRLLLGISHYRDVRPMTSDLDLAIFDEQWLTRP